jgi:hypothetical protein
VSVDIIENIIAAVKVPDELESENARDRFNHADVPDRSDEDLRRELGFVRWLLYVTDSAWHGDRERIIGHELAERRERRRDAHRTRQAS